MPTQHFYIETYTACSIIYENGQQGQLIFFVKKSAPTVKIELPQVEELINILSKLN